MNSCVNFAQPSEEAWRHGSKFLAKSIAQVLVEKKKNRLL